YQDRLRALLSPSERAVFKKLKTPNLIQDYLEALPQNFSYKAGETCRSPRRILKDKRAYCFEGAVLAAALLAYHGRKPWLLDFQTTDDDEDHVLALFKENGLWGAITKTNHPVLRWRDPAYKTVRELAMSYFHEYFLPSTGKKTFYAYSKPFDLSKYDPALWVTADKSLDWLAEDLDASRHFPTVSRISLKRTRRASKLERAASAMQEWKEKASSSGLSPF
ncbi:MAG TPA: hypothetical protein VHD37_00855, partial [Candidatus Paceibacterota bacterium]|nr:hypothetical protein [Candidatus Paceibacterota bacterium]